MTLVMNNKVLSKATTSPSKNPTPQKIKIDDKAATRAAILTFIKKSGIQVVTSSEWGAKKPDPSVDADWNYKSIAMHHSGNSFSCSADNYEQLKKIERKDDKQLTYHYAISCDGIVYELLDIRFKGSHIDNGNTGVIGIVMLADLSHPNEAEEQEYSKKGTIARLREYAPRLVDRWDTQYDTVSKQQEKALSTLISALKKYFAVNILGGHREFQIIANKQGRACPGAEGMKVVKNMRSQFSCVAPSSSNYPHKK